MNARPSVPLSGTSFDLDHGGYAASIASVGATLRALSHGGRPLVAGFARDEMRPAMNGALLAPWPNRVRDGGYAFGGETHQLVMNEAETGTASHGLIAWLSFDAVEHTGSRVVLQALSAAQPGYPWHLRVTVSYALDEEGLHHTLTVRNDSATPAPIGLGAHPYLVAGVPRECAADDWTLTLPASRILLTDDRLLPTVLVPVDDPRAGERDFRVGRRIGATTVNHAFTDFDERPGGWAWARLVDADGTGVEMTWDAPWAQVYTADQPSGPSHRHAVAVEPMTCPPDALRSGSDLRELRPGQETALRWTLAAV